MTETEPTPAKAVLDAATTSGPDLERGTKTQKPDLERENRSQANLIRQLLSSSGTMTFLAIVLALLVSALLVACFNPQVQSAAGYLFARPSDFFQAFGAAFASFFTSLLRGAIFDYEATSVARMVEPIFNSMT